ncbi:MAG: DUF4124 domain-containing protein [Comamonadaceae bacterium]|nr:DUF4124 domain-containing protein [Comamonadaceae bacterium]
MPDRMTRNAMAPARRAGWMSTLVALLLLASGAHAELHKCQDASGRVTYTDQACPSTSHRDAGGARAQARRGGPAAADRSLRPAQGCAGAAHPVPKRRRDHRAGAARHRARPTCWRRAPAWSPGATSPASGNSTIVLPPRHAAPPRGPGRTPPTSPAAPRPAGASTTPGARRAPRRSGRLIRRCSAAARQRRAACRRADPPVWPCITTGAALEGGASNSTGRGLPHPVSIAASPAMLWR